ncbi:MAG: potassium-transporting ATPase subunit C [Gallionella sp.]
MLINCVAYQNGVKIADLPVEAISDYLERPDCFVWVALRDVTDDELDKMQEEFGLHDLAVEDAVKGRVQALRDADPGNKQPVPVDLVTASGGGLDPHISPAAAEYQLARVARVRNLNPDTLRKLVAEHTEGRQFGIFGEPRVNVLELNLALDNTH